MRYVCMHKASQRDEAGGPPPPGLVEGMGALIGEMASQGVFLAGEGLKPSAQRFRLNRAGDSWKVTRGPLTGSNELPTGLALIQVASSDEALECARRLGAALGAEELEVGPLTEEWDLGLGVKPDGAPLRCMILPKATRETEGGTAPTPRQRAALAQLLTEMKAAGVLLSSVDLQPSSKAVRARYKSGERSLLDGPFTESKELIGGFCLLELGSLDEVLSFADRFVRVLGGTCELDIRPVADGADGRSPRVGLESEAKR